MKIHESWILWFKDLGSAVGLIILLNLIIRVVIENTQDFGLNIHLLRSLFHTDKNKKDGLPKEDP